MSKPFISIVMPVYNGEKYLKKNIQSVLEQRFSNFDFIICDDASTDSSIDIIHSFKDSRINILRNETNKGLFPTLNILIKKSKNEFIRLWAQDDVMKKNCLEEEMVFHNKHPDIAMSYCQFDRIDENDDLISYPDRDEGTPDVVSPELATQLSFYYGSITGNISNVMLKKSVLSDVGLFREDMKVSGDFEMWVRIIEKYPIGCIHKSLMKLRVHDNQVSKKKGIYPVFMREDKMVIDILIKRLPKEIYNHAKKYMRWHHHIQYVHYMIRSLIQGDLNTSKQSYKEISKFENVLVLILIWLVTINNRYWQITPKFVLSDQK